MTGIANPSAENESPISEECALSQALLIAAHLCFPFVNMANNITGKIA
jgi:hypothetical protein